MMRRAAAAGGPVAGAATPAAATLAVTQAKEQAALRDTMALLDRFWLDWFWLHRYRLDRFWLGCGRHAGGGLPARAATMGRQVSLPKLRLRAPTRERPTRSPRRTVTSRSQGSRVGAPRPPGRPPGRALVVFIDSSDASDNSTLLLLLTAQTAAGTTAFGGTLEGLLAFRPRRTSLHPLRRPKTGNGLGGAVGSSGGVAAGRAPGLWGSAPRALQGFPVPPDDPRVVVPPPVLQPGGTVVAVLDSPG